MIGFYHESLISLNRTNQCLVLSKKHFLKWQLAKGIFQSGNFPTDSQFETSQICPSRKSLPPIMF